MPRRDGTGPWGNLAPGRGRGGCQWLGFGNGFAGGFGRSIQDSFGDGASVAPDMLEAQAEQLEAQAAKLRNLAKQNRKGE